VQRVRQREVLLEAVLLLVNERKVSFPGPGRSACTTTTGVALPNLMTNLKTIYAKTELFRFLKPIRRRQGFKILTIRNGMPRIITEYTNPRVSIRDNKC